MFLLRRPSTELIRETLSAQHDEPLTYAQVGQTRASQCPAGFVSNHARSVIGSGEGCFRRAKEAVAHCAMLNLGWLEVVPESTPISEGEQVATVLRTMGFYSLNIARVVYVDEESPDQFGFGYGTLAEYPVSGEERFTVSFDRATDEVTYELFSFSQPSSLLTRLGWPIVRRAQRRFARESTRAMITAATGASISR